MDTTKVVTWFTTQEAAAYLGCSRNFLDKDRMTGLLCHRVMLNKTA